MTTLIRAFVSSRVDYCCSLLIGSPRSVTDKLQRVLNAAARVITINQQQQVRQRVIVDTASWPSLAGRYWTDSVPSGCNCIPVSARHGSSAPGWTVVVGSVRHNQQPGHTTLQTVNLEPMAPVPLVSLVQSAGTLYRTIGSHLTFFKNCFR